MVAFTEIQVASVKAFLLSERKEIIKLIKKNPDLFTLEHKNVVQMYLEIRNKEIQRLIEELDLKNLCEKVSNLDIKKQELENMFNGVVDQETEVSNLGISEMEKMFIGVVPEIVDPETEGFKIPEMGEPETRGFESEDLFGSDSETE